LNVQPFGRRTDDDEEFNAGIFYGPGVAVHRAVGRRPMKQVSQSAIDQIRQMFGDSIKESLPPAIEDGAARLAKRYQTTGMILLGALVVTAIATSAIAIMMFVDRA
jgi:hypothetical protein